MRWHTPAIALTLLAALGATPPARADVITFSATRSTSFFPLLPFDVQGFDPALGALEAVALRMDVAANDQTMQVIVGPPLVPSVGRMELSITRSLFRINGTPSLLTVTQTDIDFVTWNPDLIPPPFMSGSVNHTFSLPAASAGPVTLTSPSDLGFFTQAGAVTLITGGFFRATPLTPNVGPVGTPSPGLADVTVTVSYTFTPGGAVIPEPTSLTLLGLGVVGLVGYGRLRKRAA